MYDKRHMKIEMNWQYANRMDSNITSLITNITNKRKKRAAYKDDTAKQDLNKLSCYYDSLQTAVVYINTTQFVLGHTQTRI